MSLSDDEAEMSGGGKSKKEEKRRKQREEQDKTQREKKVADKDWKETAQLRLTKGGNVFHIDDYTYDIKRMAEELVAAGKITQQEVSKVSFPRLILARIIPARVNEVESFAPGKEINFGKGTWDAKWKDILSLSSWVSTEQRTEKKRKTTNKSVKVVEARAKATVAEVVEEVEALV